MKAPGTVYLVGAGPGDPELITVRGLRLLQSADVLLYDRLASPELLREAPAVAERINVGKRAGKPSTSQEQINQLLVEKARQGKTVVRLKGGDPFVFGRGGEELQACRRAGIPCEMVPGVSSSLAAPSAAGVPVTHRELSRHFVVVTAHTNGQGADLDYRALAAIDTVVVMMGRSNLDEFCRRLMAAGRSESTPAVCIERATTGRQRIAAGSLGSIAAVADLDQLGSPAVTVIGEVAAMANPATFLASLPELRESA